MQAASIFDDILQNIIHDIVLNAHREEKTARMRSAVIMAEEAAKIQQSSTLIPKDNPKQNTPSNTKHIKSPSSITLTGLIYENGKVLLRGNPLETIKETICARCRLPRMNSLITGKGSKSADLTKPYCKLHPYIDKPGHDIWGNPFPSDSVSAAKIKKEKKEREAKAAANAQAQAERASTPSSQDKLKGLTPPSNEAKHPTVTSFPNVQCNNCSRQIIITRFAKHLEQCIGIAGRQSSRNAMVKLGASQNGSSTPYGSRPSTPLPGMRVSPSKKGREDEDDEDDDADGSKRKKKKPMMKKPIDKIGKVKPVSKTRDPKATSFTLLETAKSKPPSSIGDATKRPPGSIRETVEVLKPNAKGLERSPPKGNADSTPGHSPATPSNKIKDGLPTSSSKTSNGNASLVKSFNGLKKNTSPPKTQQTLHDPKIPGKPIVSTERSVSGLPKKPISSRDPSGSFKKRKREEQENGDAAITKDKEIYQKKKPKYQVDGNRQAAGE